MRNKLITIGLAPVLIAQALYVRRMTPRLPEPAGDRSGSCGSGPSLRLLIVGDSAAAGVGVSTQNEALSGQLAAVLGTDFTLSWRLLAQTGHRAREIESMLRMALPETMDVAVTSIGVNDVTHATGLRKWIGQYAGVVDLLRGKFEVRHIILSCVPPMHLFPALPQPLRSYLGHRSNRFNEALKKFADDSGVCEFAAIHFPLDPGYMARDGFHPGAPAYNLWAQSLSAIIRRRLKKNEFNSNRK